MSEKKLSRILVDHGMHGAYPIGERQESTRVSLEKLEPIGPPRKLNTRSDQHGLDDMVVHLWRTEGIKADAFIAYNSPDAYHAGSYIQFYNIKQ